MLSESGIDCSVAEDRMREIKVCTTVAFEENSNVALKELKGIIDGSAEKSRDIDSIDRCLEVKFDWAENNFVIDKMNGVHGLTRNPEKIEFNISTKASNWREFLKSQFAHEYAHTVFMAPLDLKYESNIENWRHIMLEAHGQIFAEKAYPEIDPEWRIKFSKQEISEKWPEIREILGTEIFTESIFNSDKHHPWFGYSLAYRIGQKLLEKYEITDFHELEKEDVIKTGDQLFKEN